jgi:hypothetical protein
VLVRGAFLGIPFERHDAIGEQLALVGPYAKVPAAASPHREAEHAQPKKQC